MNTAFSRIIQAHLDRYPLMEAQDCIKLAYQNQFGPEHLISQSGDLLPSLREEWNSISTAEPHRPPEDIGNSLCRFHLSEEYTYSIAAPTLANLINLTAQSYHGTMEGLLTNLDELTHANVPGMEQSLRKYRRLGCPSVHHSAAFRAAYRPHYRLLRRDYALLFPLLIRIAKLTKTGKPKIVAIDGQSGSGKTSLSALIQKLFPCNVIHMDDFYLPKRERSPLWLEHPGGNMDLPRVRREILLPARAGMTIRYRPYFCQAEKLGTLVTLPHHLLTVVEGSYSLHPSLAELYDLCVFLTCSASEQRRRLKRREGNHFSAFETRWIPLEEQYHRLCMPQRKSDFLLDTSSFPASLQ